MTRIGWRVKLGAALALAVVTAAVAAVLLVSGSSDAASATALHRALADREAGRLLAVVRLPSGVRSTTSEAAGGSASAGGGTEPGSAVAGLGRAAGPDTAERSADWTVPESAAAVRAFLTAHPPSGTRLARVGSLSFVAIRDRPGLAAATVMFTVIAAGPETSAVRAQALVRWLVARSAAERVPAAADLLEITRGPQGHPPSLVIRITDPRRIARIRRLLNRLPIVQPGRVYHCPAQFPQVPVVSFSFRGGEGRSRVLALATEQADVRTPTTACDAMHLTIGGRGQTPLLGGYRLLRQVSALLGRRLWTAPYAA